MFISINRPFYIIMDYAEGRDLRSWCQAQGGIGKVSLEARLEIVGQVGDAMQAAHSSGVIHRDIKPSNIIISAKQTGGVQVKLTDFGIGQVVSAEALAEMTQSGFTQTMLSSNSANSGTYIYMAPELLAGKPASAASDVYS